MEKKTKTKTKQTNKPTNKNKTKQKKLANPTKKLIRDFKIGGYGLPTGGREAFGTGTRQRVLP